MVWGQGKEFFFTLTNSSRLIKNKLKEFVINKSFLKNCLNIYYMKN